jgi:transcriptional regulator with PAS, ATPase and Fis domain
MKGPEHLPDASDELTSYVDKFDELRTVFDSLPDGVVVILDREMNIATANRTVAGMLDLPFEMIVGSSCADTFRGRIPGLMDVLAETFESRKAVRNYTIESKGASGEVKSFLVSTAMIGERDSANAGVVLILHDVSEITRLRKITLQMDRYGEMIGRSEKMKSVFALVESIKDFNTSILIYGETGTGKELLARAIHGASPRRDRPFIPVNCSALPETLIESELFGHTKGAFTGAVSARKGRFELAAGGTLFLDEIGTLPLETQARLLRALQERVIEPLGSSQRIPVDIRIISATNRDLTELVAKRGFRDDLLYRLKVIQMTLPPLRERREDLPLLINHFVDKLNLYYNKRIVGISPGAEELLVNYLWPGNVRELENAIEHAFVLATGAVLEAKDLPPEVRLATPNGRPILPPEKSQSQEEEKIRRALLSTGGNREKAAEILGLHRTSLWRKMREFRIEKNFGKRGH